MLIIGIDPGISGSICFLENGKILDVIEMPTMIDGKKSKKQVKKPKEQSAEQKRIKKDELRGIALVSTHVFFPTSLGTYIDGCCDH